MEADSSGGLDPQLKQSDSEKKPNDADNGITGTPGSSTDPEPGTDGTNPSSAPDGDNSGSANDAGDGIIGSPGSSTDSGTGSNGANPSSAPGGNNSGSANDAGDGIIGNPGSSTDLGTGTNGGNPSSAPDGDNSGSTTNGANSGPGPNNGALKSEPFGTGPSGVYKPPSMRAKLQEQAGGSESIPTVPTFEQYIRQQLKEMKTKGTVARESVHQNTPRTIPDRNTYRTEGARSNDRMDGPRSNRRMGGPRSNHRTDGTRPNSFNRNEYPQRKYQQNTYGRYMSCSMLAEIARSESAIIIEKISRQKESFKELLETATGERNRDIFALVFELIANVWKSSFEETKKLLLLEICNSKFIDHLQLYMMQLPYTEDRDKLFNKHYWTKEKEFWTNFMTFCECVMNVSPSTAVRKCGALIEATSKGCLDGLKEKHEFELPVEHTARMTNIRDSLRKQAQCQKKNNKGSIDEPPESFRQLSVLPTGSELLERRPFLRANVVEGAYSDVEHYLDVQFRLLREDCFGPLREGIRKFRQLSVLPTGSELLERRPFLRANVVEGAYSDVEHYLDVQFRLLREDCFGPLREGIRKFRQLSVLSTGSELLERRPFLQPNVVEGAYSDVEHYLDVQFRLLREDCFGPLREGIRKFRQLSVLPTGSELLERRPFLRANVVEGAYSDVEHYLDVQFRLLREDCFGPLREGIRKFRQLSVLSTGSELLERRPFLQPNVVEGAYSDVEHYLDVQFRLLREDCFGPLREGIRKFRQLSVLSTGSELLERRPFLQPNVVEGAYSDVEHYLDVQFRLLREDCFGPLREGIRKFRQLSVLSTGSELLERRPFLQPNVVEGAYSDVEHYLDVQFRLLREDCFGPLREGIRKFRQLSVLSTGSELLERRPFLQPNVVEGAYSDVEHYLDLQFRLLREDCFRPLREGIHQYIEEPKKRKYDHIRVYRNVRFLEPYFAKQKFGSLVLLDKYIERIFNKVNWKQSKRFLFGSLVLFTKDNCKSFLIGTIIERDEEFLRQRQLGVSIIDSTMEADLYNGDLYTMIECEVYFEPYHHVLKALKDPGFPEQLAMSKYIVEVQKVPENPAYLNPQTVYAIKTKDGEDELKFTVLQDETWPSETELGLNSTQYEAYKLALSHEFAVIQGPPGTGKTFLGVKVAKTLLENAPFLDNTCSMLVICYTNHALDQFLEALLPITDSIVRIGGRSQSQLLEKHNISNLRGRSCYEEKCLLEDSICTLKHFHEACASTEILLSYKIIAEFAKECEIVDKFYKPKRSPWSTVDETLNHWLFEDVDGVEYVHAPFLEAPVQNKEIGKINESKDENKEVDNDIYARDDLPIDDDNDEDLWNLRIRASALVSFSLPDAEDEMHKFIQMYHNTKRKQAQLNLEGQNLKKKKEEKKKEEKKKEEKMKEVENYNRVLQELESKIVKLQSKIKVFKEMMMYQYRAPRINLTDVKDLSTVPRIERWSYYFKWANIAKTHLKKEIKKSEKKVQIASEAYEEARMIADRLLLRNFKVIGMTTSAAARLRKLLVEVAPPIVVVEEAAEVLEAHIVTSLTKSCQHLILIGDHQQLRPSAAYMRLARQYGLEVSLFERMIRNGVHSRRLGVQHRMRPEIAALVAPHIYPDLRNHRSVEDFPPVRGVTHNLFFFSHNYMEEQSEDDNSSRTNTQEADLTLRLANYLMQQGYKPDEVTIVAAYSGQMFYMRRQRPLYDHLAGVKIAVLDNYQGEESRIILLSLVRNNENNSIGFLGTENRICVALSRAKEGFFIFGNIELLKRNSTLWTNIAETLASNGSLGSTLKLKCENHVDHITAITSLEDFLKVPEGGCLLDCNFNLPSCGHPCPRMCHSYDLPHATIQCHRDCERKICEIEGHSCPRRCAAKCRPCERYVEKLLPCGHTRAVFCHLSPDDPAVYCAENVAVTLPGCGHKAVKPCSKRISDVDCVEKCESGRLSCGHACVRRCHVNHDPEHENYTCRKPCAKAKSRCAANLEDDLGDHKCPLSCAEACPPCDVQVTKKRSSCKHTKRIACGEDVNVQPCRSKCARSLPCGHHCKKLCFEKCGNCMQKVKKTIPDCNHEVEIECGTEPTRDHCRKKCERIMECGHSCSARCDKPCDQTTCTDITEHSLEAPCGHSVRLPCNLYQTSQNESVPEATLLFACTAPCGALLRCGHSCGGSCAGCRQGRLHQPCTAQCHQLNICGHRCEEPCNQVCPPCRRRCEVKCPHSGCGKLCGAPCTPCTEAECGRACAHSACKRACGAPCDRAPCERACPRALPCGHGCRGLCGEPCPPACRLCDPAGFPTDLLGDPYEDDDKLIQLQDCPHILDVNTLDTLMKSENETIQIKMCPFCRVPIINTYRYKDLVNKMLKDDINPIKEKVYGTEKQRSKMRVELFNKINNLGQTQQLAKENKYWLSAYKALRFVVGGKNIVISVLQLDMYHIYLDFLVSVGEYYTKYVAEKLTELETEMKNQVKLICEALVASKKKISQQHQADIGKELKRMNSLVQLSKLLEFCKHSTDPEILETAKTATEAVLTWRVYDEEKAVECLKKLEAAVKLSGIASKEERAMVVRAIGLKAGHWYKCPNGHFYCIGECGGAMQVSRCPECGAAIGGQNHRLTAGNQHASEMDGSRFAAWSTEANNMANFQLDL